MDRAPNNSATPAQGDDERARIARENALSTALCLLDTFAGEGLGHVYGNGQELDADKCCEQVAASFGIDLVPGWYSRVAALATQRNGAEVGLRDKTEFNRGYLIAVSNLMNLHGAEVEARDTLDQLGCTRAEMEEMGLTDYDLEPLRKLFAESESRAKYHRARAALADSMETGRA